MKTPPHNLHEITLSQWVGYQNTYGQDLDNRLEKIIAMPGGEDKEFEHLIYNVDLHTYNYAYYTDTPLDEVKTMDVNEVCRLQGAAFIAQKKQMFELDHTATYEWNGKKWKIQPLYLLVGDKLTKEQYEISTDLALIMSDLQDGRHEALYDLCAAYLRQPGEEYTSDLVEERRELMKQLPLSLSLCVKKYTEDAIIKMLRG